MAVALAVALDSTRRRDLEFFDGDAEDITITVYATDGDTAPLTVTDKVMAWGASSSMALGTSFTVDFEQRERYRITGTVAGKRTTLAYGLIVRKWDDPEHDYECGTGDYT